MNFSDFITIVSILAAVLLAVFKFDEWEIIKLKKIYNFVIIPIIFLFLSGVCSYFQSNKHPRFLNSFWENEFYPPSGFYAIIFMIAFVVSAVFFWKKFTNQKPNQELINKYHDYMEIYEPAKFSSLFRKYEKPFFNSKRDNSWQYYESLMLSEKWWSIVPKHFIEILKDSKRFHNLYDDILINFLKVQLTTAPNSQLGKELGMQWNGITLNEDTPILNIFLSNTDEIEKIKGKGILVDSIKEPLNKYFSSYDFLKRDKDVFCLYPYDNVRKEVAPFTLLPFYFIQFYDCYLEQSLKKKAIIGNEFFCFYWSQVLLANAPELSNEQKKITIANYYVYAVDVILSNINSWINIIINENLDTHLYAAEHFVKLKNWILFDIESNYINKVSDDWFINQISDYFEECILLRGCFQEKFNANIMEKVVSKENINLALGQLTNKSYVTSNEKENVDYLWLKEKLGIDL